jgi:hypothetical protein
LNPGLLNRRTATTEPLLPNSIITTRFSVVSVTYFSVHNFDSRLKGLSHQLEFGGTEHKWEKFSVASSSLP